jgi:hypothetical protein
MFLGNFEMYPGTFSEEHYARPYRAIAHFVNVLRNITECATEHYKMCQGTFEIYFTEHLKCVLEHYKLDIVRMSFYDHHHTNSG